MSLVPSRSFDVCGEGDFDMTRIFYCTHIYNMGMVLTTYPHLPLSLGLCRTVPLFPICAFTADYRETFL